MDEIVVELENQTPVIEVEVSAVGFKGDPGEDGDNGLPGPPVSLTIGEVTVVDAGQEFAQIVGESPNLFLNLGLPAGISVAQFNTSISALTNLVNAKATASDISQAVANLHLGSAAQQDSSAFATPQYVDAQVVDEAQARAEALSDEATARIADLLAEAQARSSDVDAEVAARTAAILAEATARSIALAQEATARDNAIATAISQLKGTAPGVLDTLGEIVSQMQADESATTAILNTIAAIQTALAGKVDSDDIRLTNTRTPTDGTVTDAKVVPGGLSQSSINGLVAALGNKVDSDDIRLTNTRTPTDGTVTDSKIAPGGLSQSSIAGLVTLLGTLAADNLVAHLANTETFTGSKTFTSTAALSNGLNLGKTVRSAGATLTLTSGSTQLCDATTAPFTINLPTTTGGMIYIVVKTDASVNAVTVASTDINGSATVVLGAQNDYIILQGTGTSGQWKVIGGTVTSTNSRCKTTVYLTAGSTPTWTKDLRAQIVEVEGIGGGHGGGSGAVVASGSACSGGSGGASGGYFLRKFVAATLPATVACSVAAGGVGGAGVTGAVNTPGNNGGAPGTTSFGTAALYAAYASPNATQNKGGQIAGSAASTTNLGMFMGIAGAVGNNGAAGSAGTNSTFSGCVPPSAGAGGGISTTPAAFAGGAGGTAFGGGGNGGGPGGNTGGTGSAGTGIASLLSGMIATGSAGGGGGGNVAGNGGAGGNGAAYGAPGGGGGSCLVGSTSGKGGDGAQGVLVIREWF